MPKTCIYCKNPVLERSQEHVIPQWFGTFGTDTWTLDCVCKNCNNNFSKIEINLLRDSLEWVSRYSLSKKYSSRQNKNQNIQFIIPNDFEIEYWRWCRLLLNHTTGLMELPFPAQVGFQNKDTYQYEFFFESELDTLDLNAKWLLKIDMRLLWDENSFPSLKTKVETLYWYKEKTNQYWKLDELNVSSNIDIELRWAITPLLRRAITKIVFNFLAYKIWDDILNCAFDKARDFTLWKHKEEIKIQVSNTPILADETTQARRRLDGFIIIAENTERGILCKIQFYHLFTYEILIAENVSLTDDIGYSFIFNETPKPLILYEI